MNHNEHYDDTYLDNWIKRGCELNTKSTALIIQSVLLICL